MQKNEDIPLCRKAYFDYKNGTRYEFLAGMDFWHFRRRTPSVRNAWQPMLRGNRPEHLFVLG